jgi:hypothetical protein
MYEAFLNAILTNVWPFASISPQGEVQNNSAKINDETKALEGCFQFPPAMTTNKLFLVG